MIIVIMGVSGSGKSTIGAKLAEAINWPFYDGDDFHSKENIRKMSQGTALNDEDRRGWLRSIRARIDELTGENTSAVFACSALKEAYRDILAAPGADVRFVYLRGAYELVKERLLKRNHHFMPVSLLLSQFAALEEPHDVPTVELDQTPEAIVTEIRGDLGL